jgi:hypothetical protein
LIVRVEGNIADVRKITSYFMRDQRQGRLLEVIKRDDGTFDLFLNGTLERTAVPERWLSEELCGRFGFCGEELADILRELDARRRVDLQF